MNKEVRVTPCCKTRHWSTPFRPDLPGNNFNGDIIQCELCKKEFDKELLETVVRALNPVTYFCDRCHTAATTEVMHELAPSKESV